MKHFQTSRRGTVAVIVAVCSALLLGFAAIALDGGLIQHNRRAVQAAADAAALAAANDLFINYPTLSGKDMLGTGVTKGQAAAAANGFNNDGTTNKVTVNIPPTTGLHANRAGYAEVLIEYYQPPAFSLIWGSGSTTITARAVAVGQWVPFRNGILVLDPMSPASLNNNGNGTMTVQNADVIVDSSAPNAAVATGSGTLVAPNFYITGVPGTSTSGSGTFQGNIVNNQVPTPDPLAYLDPPDPSTMMVQSTNPTNLSGNKTVVLNPGVYQGGIHVSGQVSVVLNPGIYYMDGGGFSFTGQGSLTATGVMVYTNPKSNSDVVNINGLGTIVWTPPTSGIYKGMGIWQARSSTNTLTITGNGTSQISGTFYAKKGMLTVSGNGAQDILGSQYISYDVNLGGNGNFNINWRADQTASTRLFYLVE
jgi:Flp pilus assembly protein TadG